MIDEIPLDIWKLIFIKLALTQPIKPASRDLLSACIVCLKLNKLSLQIIRQFFFHFKETSNALLLKFPEIERLRLTNDSISPKTLESMRNLTELSLPWNSRIKAENINFLSNLKVLSIGDRSNILPQSLRYLENLHSLEISEEIDDKTIFRLSNLTKLINNNISCFVRYLTKLGMILFLLFFFISFFLLLVLISRFDFFYCSSFLIFFFLMLRLEFSV